MHLLGSGCGLFQGNAPEFTCNNIGIAGYIVNILIQKEAEC
jgi:hypothetical protein